MREKATLGLVAALLAMGVLVDFTSALLSLVADGLMLGGAGVFGWKVLQGKNAKVSELTAEVASLRVQLQAQSARFTAGGSELRPGPFELVQNPGWKG
jgi:hypothetical protein